eukprot:m.7054 g.7054  ORF g.7054 m.7054 type:complete len:93 (-) comp8691_c0_seq1:53-331(-)
MFGKSLYRREEADPYPLYWSLTLPLNLSGFNLLAKGKKRISFDSLKQVSQELDEYLTHEELRSMLYTASTSGNESVSLEDFVSVMLKTNLFR